MNRVQGWRVQYEETIDTIRRDPFKWGTRDCLTGLVRPVLKAITDADYFTQYVGRYKTAKGAIGLMKRRGFSNLADVAASELTEVHPSQCFVGDIVAIPTDDAFGYSLGVVNGERIFVMHPEGLGTRDLSEAVRAFQVI